MDRTNQNYFGKMPEQIGEFAFPQGEVFYFLYLPVSLPGSSAAVLPAQLQPLHQLLEAVQADEPERFMAEHVYVTAKRMFVSPTLSANRPGWHSDGFMTDDLNYVWCDALPTIYNPGPFKVTLDDHLSLKEFEAQADEAKNVTYPVNHLVKLDDRVIHRVAMADHQIMRTFVKISISKQRYTLKNNSINHDLSYDWAYADRLPERNQPIAALI
ncbi:MAG: hypothetical protein ABI459_12135 [Deltaproteobacteria bacterium]